MQFSSIALALATASTALSLPATDSLGIAKKTGRHTCTVLARGKEQSKVDNIVKSFKECRKNASVIFPQHQTYWIDKKVHVTLDNVNIDWSGEWLQAQFWSFNIMSGKNLSFENITCSAFASNAPTGANWVQNADGFNTMDVTNATFKNFHYHGGDDCIAIKPRSFGIKGDNVTCHGGNSIAIGSLGQYLEHNSVEDIMISNVKMGHLVDQEQDSYENEGKARGGGWGKVRKLLFSNFELQEVSRGPFITQDNGNNDSYAGTSRMEISDIIFRNFTGNLKSSSGRLGEISCSKEHPCFNISFEGMNLQAADGRCR
ncbi:hypothetical protein NW762_013874 [Fusarium torreyae]|uniref:galacturonan 1,4-alpha-galacturonidase n=1 Tax=Fusarium torreyae TaxID=1237075 RepID=A0A9W8V726_9HYPO|nr:hypothetical protein NW762_013874 [Fusarium torreyae]